MKKRILGIFFCLLSITLSTACSSPQTTPEASISQSLETETPAATSLPEDTATPTEEPFQMPTGRLLVYRFSGEGGGGEYVIINLASLRAEPYKPLNFGDHFTDYRLALSPDAHYFAYVRSDDEDFERNTLYVLDIETGESVQVTTNFQANGTPSWTADGRFLEFDNNLKGFNIYDTQTGDLKHISVSSEYTDHSAISPAGDRIAYIGGCPDILLLVCPVDLYVANSDGTGEQMLVVGEMDWVFWSKDGKRIYYNVYGKPGEYFGGGISSGYSGYRLFYYDLETGQAIPVDDPRFETEAPDYSFLSPDGQYLTYRFGFVGLKLVRAPDNGLVTFLEGGDPAWSPDSRYIADVNSEGEWHLYDVQTGKSFTFDPGISSGFEIVGWLP